MHLMSDQNDSYDHQKVSDEYQIEFNESGQNSSQRASYVLIGIEPNDLKLRFVRESDAWYVERKIRCG